MTNVIGFAAHLRVYQPLAAFADAERRRWVDYIESDPPSRPVLMQREHEVALRGALAAPPRLLVDADEHAYVRHLDGLTYVCPWRLQQRTWDALTDFRSRLPDELTEAFIPRLTAEAAEMDYDEWLASHPDEPIGILSATWQVPLPWFVVVEPTERRVVLGPRAVGEPGRSDRLTAPLTRSLIYTTEMSRARRRIARALAVLRRTVAEGSIVDGLEDLGRWLEEFHPHARVELDYGGLVHLLSDDDLLEDDSCGDVAAALARLAEGDGPGAFEHYRRLATRWRQVGALESAN